MLSAYVQRHKQWIGRDLDFRSSLQGDTCIFFVWEMRQCCACAIVSSSELERVLEIDEGVTRPYTQHNNAIFAVMLPTLCCSHPGEPLKPKKSRSLPKTGQAHAKKASTAAVSFEEVSFGPSYQHIPFFPTACIIPSNLARRGHKCPRAPALLSFLQPCPTLSFLILDTNSYSLTLCLWQNLPDSDPTRDSRGIRQCISLPILPRNYTECICP
jgi:hypothetical protein